MKRTGVVLLHGKWDSPPFAVAPLEAALHGAGYRVQMPTLPWALRRLYDAPLESAFADVDSAIGQLRQAGCERIALAGHSLGAAAALACAVRRPDIDALLILAPGHFPERLAATEQIVEALDTARMATDPDARIPLVDVHQGRVRRLRVAPRSYLSYFDPTGALHWPANAARLSRPLPTLWLTGRHDAAAALGMDYAFSRIPGHHDSAYELIDADHMTTPTVAIPRVIEWLDALCT